MKNRTRRWLAAAVVVVVLGSLATTGGWAWYLRSDAYRAACVAALTASLDLPADIGRVVPRGLSAREFRDVRVWLPQRRGLALRCESAVLRYAPTADDPDGYTLSLRGGACDISNRTWLRSDYRGVLESGLRPGFSPDGPRFVEFGDMNVTLERDGLRLELRQAGGRVDFPSADRGTATIVCRNLNGYACDEPLMLHAVFVPDNGGVRIEQVLLETPRIPLAITHLEQVLGAEVKSGAFEGALTYSETSTGRRELSLVGRCADLRLDEFSRGMFGRPWTGRCPSIELQELRVVDGRPTVLRFRGAVEAVGLGSVLEAFGLRGADGVADLNIGVAEIVPGRIRQFISSGRCTELSLEKITDALGWGRMSGTLAVRIDDLHIEDDQLVGLDMTLRVEDADPDRPNWIETRLLREVARRVLHFELPQIPYERIEYTRLGLRVEVRNEELFVFGTHGPRNETILTARFFGGDWPIIREPKRSFDLKPVLDELRNRLRAEWLRRTPWPP